MKVVILAGGLGTRLQEETFALRARATADRLLPALSSWMACRRRRSSCWAVPCGLMPYSITELPKIFHSLCKDQ